MFESVTSLLIQHDRVTVFVVVLLATLGISIPALPVMLLVGAQAAGDGRFGFEALGLATLASTLSAATWYAAGRRLGRRVMAFLCRISISPDTCVRKNETSFARFERIESVELAALIERDPRPVIVDVRSLALRDGADVRVPGALRIDLVGLHGVSLDDWPASAEIITYCDCPNGASAVNAAQLMGRRGR